MLHGTVQYGLKAGGESNVDWAAHARLVKEGDKVKMEFYQVYLVCAPGDFRMQALGFLTRLRIPVRSQSRNIRQL